MSPRDIRVVMKFKSQPKRKVDGRAAIVDIDDEGRVVEFDRYRLKKITGTRVAPILGMSEHSTPFKVACELAGLYPGDKANKYIDAGNILEPVLRSYISKDCDAMLRDPLGVPAGSLVDIEEPVPKETCGYDHFHNERVFGGMVDGYVRSDGRRSAILEIKTSNDRRKWLDDEGGCTRVPMGYMLQASLYARLSRLDRIVFLVGFLEEPDYDRPAQWRPSPENTCVIVKEPLDMDGYMEQCTRWYDELQSTQCTPEWSDSEDDQAVLRYLRAYDPGRRRSPQEQQIGRQQSGQHDRVGGAEHRQVSALRRIPLRGVQSQRDHAGHGCNRGPEPADVGSRQEPLPVCRELRQHDRRGDVADHLTDGGRGYRGIPVHHAEDGTLDRVQSGHVSGKHEEEDERQDEPVIDIGERLRACDQHHGHGGRERELVWQDAQHAGDEQHSHGRQSSPVHRCRLAGDPGHGRVPHAQNHGC